MSSKIQHFLLVFDHRAGQLVEHRDFGSDSEGAVAAYAELEQEHKDHDWIDIVLVGSDSLDTVRLTHANYFDGSASVSSRFLKGIA